MLPCPEAEAMRVQGRALPEGHLINVAYIYNLAVSTGLCPIDLLGEVFEIRGSRARQWVDLAQEAGLVMRTMPS